MSQFGTNKEFIFFFRRFIFWTLICPKNSSSAHLCFFACSSILVSRWLSYRLSKKDRYLNTAMRTRTNRRTRKQKHYQSYWSAQFATKPSREPKKTVAVSLFKQKMAMVNNFIWRTRIGWNGRNFWTRKWRRRLVMATSPLHSYAHWQFDSRQFNWGKCGNVSMGKSFILFSSFLEYVRMFQSITSLFV